MGARLAVRLFRHGNLESELFDEAHGRLQVQGRWPLQVYKPRMKGVKAFSELIFDAPHIDDDGAEQVHHFACHCQTGAGQPGGWEIQLAPPPGSTDLLLRFDELLLERNRRVTTKGNRPLVFMNACGSAMVDPFSIISLPRLFLDNRNCTFIGTETRIPPKIAAFISKRFYDHLIPAEDARIGLSAARALHAAKWELLIRHGNPCGVLYTLYGDPDAVVIRHSSRVRSTTHE